MNNIQQPKPIGYQINGSNNKIILIENGIERFLGLHEKINGLNIIINGNDNFVRIKFPFIAKNSTIEIGNDNAHVEIGQTIAFSNVYIRCKHGGNQICKIGENTTIYGASITLDEESSCIIGEDCMLSNAICIWPTDGHSILNNDTKEVLNTVTEPVIIGNHVWIGQGVRITKNARIGNNCIIGGGAVACKDYKEDNVIIAGNPGKIIKRNINWDRRNPYHLQLQSNKK